MSRSTTLALCVAGSARLRSAPRRPRTWISPSWCSARPRSAPSCRRSSRRRSSMRRTGSRSPSWSVRRTLTRRSSIPANSSSAAARRCSPSGRRTCAASRSLPVQPVRLLGRRRHVAAGGRPLKDLEGKDLAAARGTTNYLMFDWFARQQGVDPARLSVVNTATPGLVGYALADRATAVQLWEPAYTILIAKKPTCARSTEGRREVEGVHRRPHIPYLGVAAHMDWIEKNPARCRGSTQTYRQAADWIGAQPRRGREADHAERRGGRPDGGGRPDPVERAARAQRSLGIRGAPGDRNRSTRPAIDRLPRRRSRRRRRSTQAAMTMSARAAAERSGENRAAHRPALAPFLLLAALWQTASFSFPEYLFPSLTDVARARARDLLRAGRSSPRCWRRSGASWPASSAPSCRGALAAAMMQFRAVDRFIARS